MQIADILILVYKQVKCKYHIICTSKNILFTKI